MIYSTSQIPEENELLIQGDPTIRSYPRESNASPLIPQTRTNQFFQELRRAEFIEKTKSRIYIQSNYIKWITLLLLVILSIQSI